MKRTLLLLLTVILSTVAMAENVTSEQALEQARNFIQKREADGSRPRRGASAAQQLSPAKQVSGLYVFNVANNGGFVIVSNDDVAIPILGYSDSGSIDPDNMPENMKAWLQGYADEIAWAKEHNVTKIVYDSPYAKTNATRRSGTAVKNPIAPLVQTIWDQGDPYNNLCPEYDSKKSYTGCVATAMAQCMYLTEKRVGSTTTNTTAEIPGYTTKTRGLTVDAIAAGTPINWDKMRTAYSAGDTDEGATAIAQLMLYCGTSVLMDYYADNFGSSGSNTYLVADALKNYFDYNSTTTYVQRSFYAYANWIELMYHELSLGRVICYGGQSSGGGHEFLIDGYESEDYFHVNWGWSGYGNDYFKLSALDPESQGIGGSSSTDGYHYGQDAVIGIQKSTEDLGAIASVPTTTVNLALNGVTFSDSPTQFSEVTVNIDLKNNSADVYDGDIGIRLFYEDSGIWYWIEDIASDFVIPANAASKTIQLTFTPSSYGTYGVYVYRPAEIPGYVYWIGYTNDDPPTSVEVAAASGDNSQTLTISDFSIDSPADLSLMGTSTLYGTTLKGSITLKNSSTETAYFGAARWQIVNSSNNIVASDEERNIIVGANSTKTYNVEVTGLVLGETYTIYAQYVKDGYWTYPKYMGFDIPLKPKFRPTAAILTTAADGTETFVKPEGTTYDAATKAPTALAVDVTGTGITTITPNANPNTVYIYSGSKPSGLDGKNVIKNEGGGIYTAENITLTDGKEFYSPVDFKATKIAFTYANDRWANGTSGWNTIMLPYDVTLVTAGDTPIDWFHSSTDEGKNFWLKRFSSDDGSTVYFDYVSGSMEANTPYIVAFPDNTWGAAWDMSGKTIKFIGENVIVSKGGTVSSTTGANYRFIGNTVQDNTANIYCINATGSAFELVPSAGCSPFRAYFKPGIFDHSVTSLSIGGGTVTGISKIKDVRSKKDDIYYDLNGRRVLYPKKGVYILNGNKVIIK